VTAPWMKITCRCDPPNIFSLIGPMPKKTTDKKPAGKKDAGKKPNAGKDADGSKVRQFLLVGIGIGPMSKT